MAGKYVDMRMYKVKKIDKLKKFFKRFSAKATKPDRDSNEKPRVSVWFKLKRW